jgi:transposase
MISKAPTRCYLKCKLILCWQIKAFDADERVPLRAVGKTAVIPPRSNHINQRFYDKAVFKARHLIENFFCNLKKFRAIATRYDRTAKNLLAAFHLAAAVIWLN